MRTIIDVLGCVLVGLGIVSVFGGCLLAYDGHIADGLPFWIGVVVIVVGWAMSSMASHKTCPHCSEMVKYKATKCKHCGSEIAATHGVRASEPFYK